MTRTKKSLTCERDWVNYAISEKEVGCDDVDKDDKGDWATQLTDGSGCQGGQDDQPKSYAFRKYMVFRV